MKAMNMNKRILRILAITQCLLLLIWAVPAASASSGSYENATYLTFSDDSVTASGNSSSDYEIDGTNLTIKGEGTFVLSGSCSDGTVTVKKGVTGVNLVLDGLDLTSLDSAPVTFNKSSGVNLIVADGSENTLTDSEKNNDDNYPDNQEAENAVLKCKDGSTVTISGSGVLNINSKGKNGIKSGATTDEEGEAWLLIQDVTLNITAEVNDAVNAESKLVVKSGKITVSAADDGLHSDYIMDIGAEGTDGPEITINKCYEGLEAANLNIYSGNINIYAEDDCLNAANSDLSDYDFSINISGGTMYMQTTSGDGIDSNGTLDISGGGVTVFSQSAADNQPLDADGKITITGGTVFAAGNSAGMGMNLSASQAYVIYGSSGMMGGVGGGRGDFNGNGGPTPPDNNTDTKNGADPPEMPSGAGNMGAPQGTGTNGSDAEGGGNDSGDLPMTAQSGQEPPQMPSDGAGFGNGNSDNTPPEMPSDMPSGMQPGRPGAFDNSGENGEAPGEGFNPGDGGQSPFGQSASALQISKDSTVSIKDSSSNTVFSVAAPFNLSYVFFSSPELVSSESYTLYSDGSECGVCVAGTEGVQGSAMTGGDSSADDESTNDNQVAVSTGDNVTEIVLISAGVLILLSIVMTIIVLKGKKAPDDGAGQ